MLSIYLNNNVSCNNLIVIKLLKYNIENKRVYKAINQGYCIFVLH